MYHQTFMEEIQSERIPTMADNVKRFRKFGKMITRIAKSCVGQVAQIGKIERPGNETIYVIFYPDGTFDRFEDGRKVTYRAGWTGPDLTTARLDDDLAEMIHDALEEVEAEEAAAVKTVAQQKKELSDEQKERKRARARELYALKKQAEGLTVKPKPRKKSISKNAKTRVLH